MGTGLLEGGLPEELPTGDSPVGTDTAVVLGPEGAGTVGAGPVVLDPEGTGTGSVPGLPVSVTGQTVVEIAMVEVTTVVESAGQLVTVGAQLVMVTSLVAYTVEVVIRTGVLAGTVTAPDEEGTTGGGMTGEEDVGLTPVPTGVLAGAEGV